MGLGRFPEISLMEARDTALDKRSMLRGGVDPITERRAARFRWQRENELKMLFKDATAQYIAAHRNSWKNGSHAKQWENSMARYVFPVIGDLAVREITLAHILKVLEPMWQGKTETASRLRGRIELVLDWAKVRGFREGDNPAAWRGNLETLLPARSKVVKVKHHSALAWEECPGFFARLAARREIGSEALRLCILTACRSGEICGAEWQEFDLERAVWTIPAERMKAGREHRVPLSPRALEVLNRLPRFAGEKLVFASERGTTLRGAVLREAIHDLGGKFTVHGFRSTFRDWAGESTAHAREVIEHALAHQLKDKAEAAYARGDLFTKRTALMEDWGHFLSSDM